MENQENIIDLLRQVIHPEYGQNIVELGIVKEIKVEKNEIIVSLAFKRKNDPLANSLIRACNTILKESFSDRNIVIEVAENKTVSVKDTKPDSLAKVKNIIIVASGKGGVGKSTVAANLAVALSLEGKKVGLLDADIFGPSIPKLFHTEGENPKGIEVDGFDMIEPIYKFGVKLLSIGYMVAPESALIWRGPMASKALKQLIEQGNWGELDYLIIDTPPGTSDIHLTLIQTLKIKGVIVVSTPQEVALIDVERAIEMFNHDGINVPVLGMVENMAWFTPAELPDKKYFIFGKNGCVRLSEKYNLPLLGQIPIVQSICDDGDKGNPSALNSNSIEGKAFMELARRVSESVEFGAEIGMKN